MTMDLAEEFDALVLANGGIARKAKAAMVEMGAPEAVAHEQWIMYLERQANSAYNHYRRNGWRQEDGMDWKDAVRELELANSSPE
jgi:hypothetical protein